MVEAGGGDKCVRRVCDGCEAGQPRRLAYIARAYCVLAYCALAYATLTWFGWDSSRLGFRTNRHCSKRGRR